MANRAMRRAMMRQQTNRNKALIADYSKQQLLAGLVQNGITIKDLEEEYHKGWKEGFAKASEPVVRACYAGVALVLREKYGFGAKRVRDVLTALDDKLIYALTSQELIDEVWEQIGLHLDFQEPMDRITEK